MNECNDGENSIDTPGTVALLVQVPRHLRKEIRVAAARNDLTISEFVTRLLAETLGVEPTEDDTFAA